MIDNGEILNLIIKENDILHFTLPNINFLPVINARRENPIKNKNGSISIINSELPITSGVYFIYDKNQILLYIGRAVNIKKRISIHLSKISYPYFVPDEEIEFIKFILLKDEKEIDLLESFFIYLYQPKYNKAINVKKYTYL